MLDQLAQLPQSVFRRRMLQSVITRDLMNMAATQSLLDACWSLNEGGTPLNTFQRVLLMTDGTVTDILEAHVAESICVVRLTQSFGCDDPEMAPECELLKNERVLHRTVLLQGTSSGTNFLHGESIIVPDRLPAPVLEGLLTTDKPIGRLLAENRVETFREIVGLGFEPACEYGNYFGVDPESQLVFRTYRIYVRQRAVMRITEKFPISWFGDGIDLGVPGIDP